MKFQGSYGDFSRIFVEFRRMLGNFEDFEGSFGNFSRILNSISKDLGECWGFWRISDDTRRIPGGFLTTVDDPAGSTRPFHWLLTHRCFQDSFRGVSFVLFCFFFQNRCRSIRKDDQDWRGSCGILYDFFKRCFKTLLVLLKGTSLNWPIKEEQSNGGRRSLS